MFVNGISVQVKIFDLKRLYKKRMPPPVCIDLCIGLFLIFSFYMQIKWLGCIIDSYYRTIKIKELPHI